MNVYALSALRHYKDKEYRVSMEKVSILDNGEEIILKLEKLNLLLERGLGDKEENEKERTPSSSFEY